MDNTEQQAVTVAQLQKVQDWLREPDHAEHFGTQQILEWINRRPTHIIPSALGKLALSRLASVSSASAEGIKASAAMSLMYLQTGFIECPQCGEEVPTKTLDAAYELGTVVQPALTIGGTVRPEPVPATNQAGEVALRAGDRVKFATGEAGEIIRCDYIVQLDEPDGSQGAMGGSVGIWTVDASELTRAALATQPATSQEGEAQQWRHKLWMVACHATGGGIPEIEGIDRSINDICVQITQARNAIYQAGKDAVLAASLSEDLRQAAQALMDRWPTDQHDGSPLYDEANNLRAARAQVKAS